MEENTELMTVDSICNHVYVIRGQQVMLDCDLARIYGYEVKRLNEQVKNNISRFPEDFMFKLTKFEVEDLRSKNSTANIKSKSRTLPYAFTEQGIYMLATVLRGELAEQQSKRFIVVCPVKMQGRNCVQSIRLIIQRLFIH